MRTYKFPEYCTWKECESFIEWCDAVLKDDTVKNNKICFNFTCNQFISTLATLIIAQRVDAFKKKDYELVALYDKEDKANRKWYMNLMGLSKTKREVLLDDYHDTFRVKIQRCFSLDDSLVAVNKIMNVVKSEFELSETVVNVNQKMYKNGKIKMYNYGKVNYPPFWLICP